MADAVVWPVTPKVESRMTRPVALLRALAEINELQPHRYHFHSARRSSAVNSDWRRHAPMASVSAAELAGHRRLTWMTPLLRPTQDVQIDWLDLYDDWSLAPELPLPYRLFARQFYNRFVSQTAPRVLTVNTRYLEDRMAQFRPVLVPNGVDAALCRLTRSGDDRRRLVILGAFRRGRTDFRLISELAPGADEVVVAGPGWKSVRSHLMKRGVNARFEPYMNWHDIARMTGPRTLALLPHLVNDYTLSQDAMKVYSFVALGMPVLLPGLLSNDFLPMERLALLGPGVSARELLEWAFMLPYWQDDERVRFGTQHSWEQRARRIRELFGTIE